MILSFHPIIEADENIICAGREPNSEDLSAIKRADAVILPQGCLEPLYRMARGNCPNIFPNMDVRFDYPGKSGQIRLFRQLSIAHPRTELFSTIREFDRQGCDIELPVVIKLDWGGQGDTVFKADTPHALQRALTRVKDVEKTGQSGFLVQEFIPAEKRSLRVVVIGESVTSYWRIQHIPDQFGDSISKGARIEHKADPDLQTEARSAARRFCQSTGLQLAGLDFIFSQEDLKSGRIDPLMLEINYYFGRTGLGGSERFYKLLTLATDHWLQSIGLRRPAGDPD